MVSRSSVEAEYRSLAFTVDERLKWLVYLLQDFCLPPTSPIPLWCDNHVTLHIVANQVLHEHMKNLDNDYYFVRDENKPGLILPCYVSSTSQIVKTFLVSRSLLLCLLLYLPSWPWLMFQVPLEERPPISSHFHALSLIFLTIQTID